MKYYKENAENEAKAIPQNKLLWDVIEENFYQHIDVPALEYFGRTISRKDFIDSVYLWARVFRQMGVKENEIVAFYGPLVPEVGYMTFALNLIGACPYFLKLAINKEALAEETVECRFAVVFEQMWDKVSSEFCKDKYEKVIVYKLTDSMPFLKRTLVLTALRMKKANLQPQNSKILFTTEAKKLVGGKCENLRVPLEPNRRAFITSSSGTTVGGVVKGVVATNESAIAQLCMSDASKCPFFPGDRCLNNFPLTASTSLNLLFFYPLYRGMTVVIDPRVSEKDFFNQVTRYRTNVICTTGSAWEAFINRLSKSRDKYDFSFAKCWVIGGEGTDSKKYSRWQAILKNYGSTIGLVNGYGTSEVFSSACYELLNARVDCAKSILSVGIPFAGMTVGVFDKLGNELTYNQRGELWIKSNSAMKEYYNKPELTDKTKIDRWIHTGDLAEIDDKGFVYIWGRLTNTVSLPNGREVYLFDIENLIKKNDFVLDAAVFQKHVKNQAICLVAHIVWAESANEDKKNYLKTIADDVNQYDSQINLCIFTFHEQMLPYSPTTLKKDRNKMSEQMDGYVMLVNNQLRNIEFCNLVESEELIIVYKGEQSENA